MRNTELTLENLTEALEYSKKYIHEQGFKDQVFADAETIIDLVGLDGFIYISSANLQSTCRDLEGAREAVRLLLKFLESLGLPDDLIKFMIDLDEHQKPFDA